MKKVNDLMKKMIVFDEKDPMRIQHFLKVYEFSRLIGELEELDERTQMILEYAAIVHDIGIHPALEKYGQCDGKLQEQEGPACAEKMLKELGIEENIIRRVAYLVGHHHTYTDIDGKDYQILVEADFLVNIYEDSLSTEAASKAYHIIFKTDVGKELCRRMYGVEE